VLQKRNDKKSIMLPKYASLALSIFFLRLKYAVKLSVRPYLYCIHTVLYNKVYFFVAFAIFCSVMKNRDVLQYRFEIQTYSFKARNAYLL